MGQAARFPIATLLPLYGLVMALQIALTKFASVEAPASPCSASPGSRVHLALGAMAGLMAIGWLLTDTGDKQIGNGSRFSAGSRSRSEP